MTTPTADVRARIGRLYDAYNSQDLTTLTALVQEDVDWPDNDDERLHGRAAVGDYWSRQWTQTRTRDEVIGIAELGPDRTAVRISQVVHDLDGVVLSRGAFEHTFQFRDGLVARMDLRTLRPPSTTPRSDRMADDELMLRELYESFNRRDIPALLARLHRDVVWANGLEGGHVHGHDAARDYWTRQWASIRTRVDPLQIAPRGDGATAVEVHQVVHDLDGRLLLDEMVRHVFRIEGGLVSRFDVDKAGGLSSLANR